MAATKKATKKKATKRKAAKKPVTRPITSSTGYLERLYGLEKAAEKALAELKQHRKLVPGDQSEHLTNAHDILRDALRK